MQQRWGQPLEQKKRKTRVQEDDGTRCIMSDSRSTVHCSGASSRALCRICAVCYSLARGVGSIAYTTLTVGRYRLYILAGVRRPQPSCLDLFVVGVCVALPSAFVPLGFRRRLPRQLAAMGRLTRVGFKISRCRRTLVVADPISTEACTQHAGHGQVSRKKGLRLTRVFVFWRGVVL